MVLIMINKITLYPESALLEWVQQECKRKKISMNKLILGILKKNKDTQKSHYNFLESKRSKFKPHLPTPQPEINSNIIVNPIKITWVNDDGTPMTKEELEESQRKRRDYPTEIIKVVFRDEKEVKDES